VITLASIRIRVTWNAESANVVTQVHRHVKLNDFELVAFLSVNDTFEKVKNLRDETFGTPQ
jgi:hypothetical protein